MQCRHLWPGAGPGAAGGGEGEGGQGQEEGRAGQDTAGEDDWQDEVLQVWDSAGTAQLRM